MPPSRLKLLLLLLIPVGALAHHSAALIFDMNREITVSGVVTEFNMGNPHLRVFFDVETDGETVNWMAEGGSRTVLLRAGWNEDQLKPGDRISIKGHPSRDGSNVIHLEYITLPDGTEKFGEDLDRSNLERLRRDR